MSSAKRRINSTGRKRIGRECIEINLLDCLPHEPLMATVSLDLSTQGFPGDSLVAIEAYHRSSSMRFDCGTIDDLRVPDILILNNIDRSGAVLFRLKVINNNAELGKLLGSAERLRPKSQGISEGRRSLFPIEYRDMGGELWRVEIAYGDRPTLLVNTRIPGFNYKLQENPMMQGLLLPAALRFVLQELVSSDGTGENDDERGWKDEWFEYCNTELGREHDPRDFRDDDQKKDWIDETVLRFCENLSFVDRIRSAPEEVR